MRVPEITKKTHLSRPAVSHHLKILKDTGLVNIHHIGTMSYYYLDTAESCWNGLKTLTEHINIAINNAKKNGYPNFKEE